MRDVGYFWWMPQLRGFYLNAKWCAEYFDKFSSFSFVPEALSRHLQTWEGKKKQKFDFDICKKASNTRPFDLISALSVGDWLSAWATFCHFHCTCHCLRHSLFHGHCHCRLYAYEAGWKYWSRVLPPLKKFNPRPKDKQGSKAFFSGVFNVTMSI